MEQREKLIELIHEFGLSGYKINDLVNYLLDKGVVVLPCKVGDTVCWVKDGKIYEGTVYHIEYSDYRPFGIRKTVSARIQPSCSFGVSFDDFGKTVFLTREEAEAAL